MKISQNQNVNVENLFEKKLEKGAFYFIKTASKEIATEDELKKIIPKCLNGISWKNQ